MKLVDLAVSALEGERNINGLRIALRDEEEKQGKLMEAFRNELYKHFTFPVDSAPSTQETRDFIDLVLRVHRGEDID